VIGNGVLREVEVILALFEPEVVVMVHETTVFELLPRTLLFN
jgi:hypothetical protein